MTGTSSHVESAIRTSEQDIVLVMAVVVVSVLAVVKCNELYYFFFYIQGDYKRLLVHVAGLPIPRDCNVTRRRLSVPGVTSAIGT